MRALSKHLGAERYSDDSDTERSLKRKSLYERMWPVIAAFLYYCGLVPLTRWWMRRSGGRLLILGYHRASGNLRQHILYLQRHYRILSLETALEEMYGARRDGLQQLDRRTPVVLTFDDGYYDNYTDAFPLSRELRFPFTIFLIPGYIDDANRFWWLAGDYLARHAQVNVAVIDGCTYHLDRHRERRALAKAIDARARCAQSVAEREAFLVATQQALSVPSDQPATTPKDKLTRSLTWPEVHEMESSGWVSFGAHTVHHPVLVFLHDPAEVQREVHESRATLEQRLGYPVRAFAYPIGRLEDIGMTGFDATREAGYSSAVTTVPGFNTPSTDPYALRRVNTDTDEHWWVLAAQAAGVWGFLAPSRLLRAARHMSRRLFAPASGSGNRRVVSTLAMFNKLKQTARAQ